MLDFCDFNYFYIFQTRIKESEGNPTYNGDTCKIFYNFSSIKVNMFDVRAIIVEGFNSFTEKKFRTIILGQPDCIPVCIS